MRSPKSFTYRMCSVSRFLFSLGIAYFSMLAGCRNRHSNSNIKNVQNADTTKSEKITDGPGFADIKRIELPQGSKFTHKDEFESDSFKIIVNTHYINDTLSDYYAWEAINWPIVEKQTITFKYNDSIHSVFDFPAKKISRKTSQGKTVRSAEMVMWYAGFVKGEKGVFFGIFEAHGLCLGAYCPVYNGLFKLNGEPVYQLFHENREQFLLIGNEKDPVKNGLRSKYDSIQVSNGISVDIMDKAWKNKKEIGLRK